MTEFELISLFNQFFDDTFSRLSDFMAGTFAMVISAFFVGARLSQNMARLVIFLYTVFSMATSVPTLAASYRFTRMAGILKDAAGEPGSIINLIFPTLPSPYIVMPVMTLVLIGAYAGTLAFFYQTRKGLVPTSDSLK